jgi:hypothetical protein
LLETLLFLDDWARPIFNLDTDYKLLTREERQQRDADQASLKRQTSLTGKPKIRGADMDLPFASDRYAKLLLLFANLSFHECFL